MSLNKFLCKHFDLDNQGYVTIFDIVAGIGMYAIVGCVALLILEWIGASALMIVYPDGHNYTSLTMQSLVVTGLVGSLVVCIAIVVMFIGVYIAAYRVAECPKRPN